MQPRLISCFAAFVAVAITLLIATATSAQVTDADGFITSSNWLALGPFKQSVDCGRDDADLLANFIAPSAIPCEYPSDGDDVEYDPFRAASIDYVGPVNELFLPVWRALDDGIDDATLDLLGDPGYGCVASDDRVCTGVVTWAATYVAFTGDAPVDVTFCVGHDDGGQLWLDDELLYNRAGCGRHDDCRGSFTASVTPGPHRVAVASFYGGGGGWQVSLALLRDGEPITDDDPDWTFFGIERPAGVERACPAIASPVRLTSCEVNGLGGVDLAWENPDGASGEQSIVIEIDGDEVARVPGDELGASLDAADFPSLAGGSVCVINESGFPACCDVVLLGPVTIDDCAFTPGGDVEISWTNPIGARPEQRVAITADGEEIAAVGGDETRAIVPADALPGFSAELCVVNASGTPACCNPHATTADGRITTRNWLVLGPFRMERTIECNGRERDEHLLENFIAPAEIACEFPFEGDRIEYDAGLAATSEYLGPRSERDPRPIWRLLEDETPDDGRHDFSQDPLSPGATRDAMVFLATYVEYRGDAPIDVSICLGVDDGRQVWLDDELVYNRNGCGGDVDCRESVSVTVRPGAHRIAIGAFNGPDPWSAEVSLRIGDEPIVDDPVAYPDWSFHGGDRPASLRGCTDGVDFIRGDCDGDGRVSGSLNDAVFHLNHLFLGGPDPGCAAACDANADGAGAITDAIYLLGFNFLGGPPPPAPFPDCGPASIPSDETSGCELPPTPCR